MFENDINNSKKINMAQAKKNITKWTRIQSYLLNLYKPLI
jgi:hypothetical protein